MQPIDFTTSKQVITDILALKNAPFSTYKLASVLAVVIDGLERVQRELSKREDR